MNKSYHIYGFEKLQVWQASISLATEIYKLTENFPQKEIFGLTSQIKRSVTSVSANISEGSARLSQADRARFYQIAFSSLMETLNHLILAKTFDYVDQELYEDIRWQIDALAVPLNGLHKSQLKGLKRSDR
jgi:four helix bundle protein